MKLRAILKCCELSGLLGSDGGLRNGESQRDSDSKPSNGIARNKLLWGNQDHGYNPERVAALPLLSGIWRFSRFELADLDSQTHSEEPGLDFLAGALGSTLDALASPAPEVVVLLSVGEGLAAADSFLADSL